MSSKKNKAVETTAETTDIKTVSEEVETPTCEDKYYISDFVSNAKKLFNTSDVVVKTALELTDKTEFTLKEAIEIVNKFKNKEVK